MTDETKNQYCPEDTKTKLPLKNPCRRHFSGETFTDCPNCGWSGEFTPYKEIQDKYARRN